LGFYSDDIIKEVQDRADILEIVSEYTSLKKRGDSYIGLCPFHSEKTPSFNVDVEKKTVLLFRMRCRRKCIYFCYEQGEP